MKDDKQPAPSYRHKRRDDDGTCGRARTKQSKSVKTEKGLGGWARSCRYGKTLVLSKHAFSPRVSIHLM